MADFPTGDEESQRPLVGVPAAVPPREIPPNAGYAFLFACAAAVALVIAAIIATLVLMAIHFAHTNDELDDLKDLVRHGPCECEYETDVLIVGSGPAGLAQAYQLFYNSSLDIVILEWGADFADPNQWSADTTVDHTVPSASGVLITQRADMFYGAIGVNEQGPPPYEHGIMGKCLGGGSTVNGMQEVHQSAPVSAELEAVTGNTGAFSHAALMAHSKEIENYQGLNGLDRGYAGPQTISRTNTTVLGLLTAQAAVAAFGYPIVEDYNDGVPNVGPILSWDLSIKNNWTTRASADVELLTEEMRQSSRVRILTRHMATTLRFAGRTATGINFVGPDGKGGCVHAKHTTLAANIENPRVLERSGVGDPAILSKLGIPIVAANPSVGQVLLNHQGLFFLFQGPSNATGVLDPNQLYAGGGFYPLPSSGNTMIRETQWIVFGQGPVFAVFVLWNRHNTSDAIPTSHIATRSPADTGRMNEKVFVTDAEINVFDEIVLDMIIPWMDELKIIDPAFDYSDPPLATLQNQAARHQWFRRASRQAYHYQNTTGLGYALNPDFTVKGVEGLTVIGSSTCSVNNDGNMQWFSRVTGWMNGKLLSAKLSMAATLASANTHSARIGSGIRAYSTAFFAKIGSLF